jgi:hypothetical protein
LVGPREEGIHDGKAGDVESSNRFLFLIQLLYGKEIIIMMAMRMRTCIAAVQDKCNT